MEYNNFEECEKIVNAIKDCERLLQVLEGIIAVEFISGPNEKLRVYTTRETADYVLKPEFMGITANCIESLKIVVLGAIDKYKQQLSTL